MKKLLAILLTLVITLGLCGCSESPSVEWYTEGSVEITEQQVENIVSGEFKAPKNVILIIGDGMGANDLILAEKYADGVYDFGLVLNKIEHSGWATTHSADNDVTDSAASATALSTGVKTNNGYIAKDPMGNDLLTMLQRARKAGKRVGVITDERISGATPSAFTVNNINRSNTTEIINSFIRFKPDVLIGMDYEFTYANIDWDGRDILDDEYACAENFEQFKDALDSDKECKKAFAGFIDGYSNKPSNTLANCAEVAFKRLQNENGFFVMIESSATDKFGHGSAVDINGKLNGVVTLDRTVAAALKFMEQNPDTLLIVTADHETGGVRIPEEGEELSTALSVNAHTAAPVRVFAVGKGAEYFGGKTVDNTDIAKFIIGIIENNN